MSSGKTYPGILVAIGMGILLGVLIFWKWDSPQRPQEEMRGPIPKSSLLPVENALPSAESIRRSGSDTPETSLSLAPRLDPDLPDHLTEWRRILGDLLEIAEREKGSESISEKRKIRQRLMPGVWKLGNLLAANWEGLQGLCESAIADPELSPYVRESISMAMGTSALNEARDALLRFAQDEPLSLTTRIAALTALAITADPGKKARIRLADEFSGSLEFLWPVSLAPGLLGEAEKAVLRSLFPSPLEHPELRAAALLVMGADLERDPSVLPVVLQATGTGPGNSEFPLQISALYVLCSSPQEDLRDTGLAAIKALFFSGPANYKVFHSLSLHQVLRWTKGTERAFELFEQALADPETDSATRHILSQGLKEFFERASPEEKTRGHLLALRLAERRDLPSLRREALGLLGSFGASQETTDLLLEAFLQEQDAGLRRNLVITVIDTAVDQRDVARRLIQFFDAEQDSQVRVAIVRSLRRFPADAVQSFLTQVSQSADAEIAKAAEESLRSPP